MIDSLTNPPSNAASPVAVVTGASAGIGAATVRALSHAGYSVVFGARRLDRLETLAAQTGGRALHLDVTDAASIDSFVAQVPEVRLLVNNAGGALGVDSIEEARIDLWLTMFNVNVLGTLRMTQALLPKLRASGDGQVINISSIAGFETYLGGAGYTAAKHAVRAMTRTLRLELLGQPMRVTEISPGMVETEFSLVRLGEQELADKVYRGMTPLTADDIAETIVWAASRPAHVNIDEIVIRPRDQATAHHVFRRQN